MQHYEFSQTLSHEYIHLYLLFTLLSDIDSGGYGYGPVQLVNMTARIDPESFLQVVSAANSACNTIPFDSWYHRCDMSRRQIESKPYLNPAVLVAQRDALLPKLVSGEVGVIE